MKQLPKPGSYAYYLQQNAQAFATGSMLQMTKKAFKAQKKAEKQAAKAAQQAANAAQQAAAAAAGGEAGKALAAGFMPGEAQLDTGGGSTPFAGGSTSSTVAKVAALALPLGLVALGAWYLLKRKRKR